MASFHLSFEQSFKIMTIFFPSVGTFLDLLISLMAILNENLKHINFGTSNKIKIISHIGLQPCVFT